MSAPVSPRSSAEKLARGARRGGLRAHLAAAMVVLTGALYGGCGDEAEAPSTPAVVGPAPLRRMSNSEYLNALHDLFPEQAPTLPTLPNDADVAGFENAAEAQQPSDVRIARFESIANIYAEGATRDAAAVRAVVGCDEWATPTRATECANQFIDRAGLRLFRRPLAAEEHDRFALRFQGWKTSIDFEAAVRLTLSAMLQSPQFLYRPEPPPTLTGSKTKLLAVEPYAMASRLSFFLWESVPDDVLLAAAGRDELRTEAQLRAQAERMLADARARRVLWSFHRQWLGLDRILGDEHQFRTPQIDPGWTSATPAAASTESRLFVENVLSGNGTLRDLLTSRRAWVNGDMARIYGVQAPQDAGAWQEVELRAGERGGIVTRVAFLAGLSHRGGTSPPIRGNGIQLRFLCRLPMSPPPGVDLSMPVADPKDGPKTNRTLFEERTAPSTCMGCHRGLNGFGFGFERYNAAGAFQTQEQGLPIDARGTILGTDVDRPFDGAMDLSDALATSNEVHRCATRQWLRYALGRAPTDEEYPLVSAMAAKFHESGGNVRALLLQIVTAPTFRMRKVPES